MTRRHVLHAAAAVVAVVWHRVSTIGAGRGAPAVAPLPQTPAALIVDHQGWIVRASDRDALRGRLAGSGRVD